MSETIEVTDLRLKKFLAHLLKIDEEQMETWGDLAVHVDNDVCKPIVSQLVFTGEAAPPKSMTPGSPRAGWHISRPMLTKCP